MKVLLGSRWRDGYLDEWRGPGDVRVQVFGLRNLERVTGLYFVPPRRLGRVWNYVREVGVRAVARKVASRLRERARNEKWLSAGYGRVLEAPPGSDLAPASWVAFVAPAHPPCLERIVLPLALVVPIPPPACIDDRCILFQSQQDGGEPWWSALLGWSKWSGSEIPRAELSRIRQFLRDDAHRFGQSQRLELTRTEVQERREPLGPHRQGKQAILFGLGNYAKTNILPNIRANLVVTAIHEIDPLQLPSRASGALAWDTSPLPRENESAADAWFIAGFHHSHAPLAALALRRGAAAVVEKPLATTTEQLADLESALQSPGARYFACFHKRYSSLNTIARRDLGVMDGDPISYHCIVYEVPLPEHHWYRWPNSRSRLTSNGCHWLDHFLYLNAFSTPTGKTLTVANDQTVNCSVSLANGAFFTMILTDRGADRIGMQELVELRTPGRTVRIINNADYLAEGEGEMIRKVRLRKTDAYRSMYHLISRKIRTGKPGDAPSSALMSTRLTLELEALLTETQPLGCEQKQAAPLIPARDGLVGVDGDREA